MSFPGTYNISYYYGDTLEFRVYPKNSSGAIFDLASYELARFTIAPTRSSAEDDKISAYATISADKTNILCAIRPEDSENLDPDTDYVYDIEISKSGSPYDIVYTILTGTISITRDITKTETNVVTEVPNNPTSLVLTEALSSALTVSWTAPVGGGVVQYYRVAILPFTTDTTTLANAATASTTLISGNLTQHVFFGLNENTDYSIAILANNALGDASTTTLLTNTSAFRTLDNPATVDPDFFVTADGSTAYIINTENNPTLTLVRGETYVFNVDAPGEPLYFQLVPGAYNSENVYDVGVTNIGTDSGNIIWFVDPTAPNTLYYASSNSFNLNGQIDIIDGVS